MSVGLSSTLRFGMAALATLPWLLALDDEADQDRRFQKLFDPNGIEFQAALGGLEVGMWNSIGYVVSRGCCTRAQCNWQTTKHKSYPLLFWLVRHKQLG